MYPGEYEDKFICSKCGCGRSSKNRVCCWCQIALHQIQEAKTASRLEYNPKAPFTEASCPECEAKYGEFHDASCSKPTLWEKRFDIKNPVRNQTKIYGSKPLCSCGAIAGELHKDGCQDELCPFHEHYEGQKTVSSCGCIGARAIAGPMMTIHPVRELTLDGFRCQQRCSVCGAYRGSSHTNGCKVELCPIHPNLSLSSCGCKVVKHIYPEQSPVGRKEANIFRPTYRPFRGSAGRSPGRKLK